MGRKPLNEDQIVVAICYSVMEAHKFNYQRRLDWEIWGAKTHECPTCHSSPFFPCVNMAHIRSGALNPRANKRPHAERINWGMILNGLKSRGLYTPALETQVRNQVR